MKHLILGGARSGKSRFALKQAKACEKSLFYVATGWAGDTEMAERIQLHQSERGPEWSLIEEPVSLAKALEKIDSTNNVVVVDCLTLWLSNLLHANALESERDQLFALLPKIKSSVMFVSNEVGSGIVPLGELNRIFADEAGRLNQYLAEQCDRATLVVAGIPLKLK